MFQPVTDANGQTIGYSYVDVNGVTQFVPVVGMPANFMQSTLPPPPAPPASPPTTMGWLSADGRDQFAPRGYSTPAPSSNAFGAPSQPGAGFGGPAASQGAGAGGYYQKFAGLNAKLRGQAGEAADTVRAKATGTYDSGYPTDADYARSERLMNKDYRQDDRYATQVQRSQALFANPIAALNPDMSRRDYAYFSQAPLTQLAFLTQGAAGKDKWTTNHRRFGNAVQGMANNLENGMSFQRDSLMQNLFNPGARSALARSFMTLQQGDPRYDKNGLYQGTRRDKWQWAPASTQADTMRSYMSAIYNTTTAPQFRTPAMNYVNQLIDQWVGRAYADQKPGSLQDWLGSQLGY